MHLYVECIHVCAHEHIEELHMQHVCAHACGGQRVRSAVISQVFYLFYKTGLLSILELTK